MDPARRLALLDIPLYTRPTPPRPLISDAHPAADRPTQRETKQVDGHPYLEELGVSACVGRGGLLGAWEQGRIERCGEDQEGPKGDDLVQGSARCARFAWSCIDVSTHLTQADTPFEDHDAQPRLLEPLQPFHC
jgi:hypothetical protein